MIICYKRYMINEERHDMMYALKIRENMQEERVELFI